MLASMVKSSMPKEKMQDHWFYKLAKNDPAELLPHAVIGAIRGIITFQHCSAKSKVQDIQEIIEIYDALQVDTI